MTSPITGPAPRPRASDVVDIVEREYPSGIHARLIGLPPGMMCQLAPCGGSTNPTRYRRTTRASRDGLIRYCMHMTYQDAVDAALSWGRRKVQEHLRESMDLAHFEDVRQMRLKAQNARLNPFTALAAS